ncbi:MAG: hypothetical protein IOC66_15325 [Burkholderia sp.]|jgi:hypothetical protein|nr:hypothetical protein [Burkholderia sp.]
MNIGSWSERAETLVAEKPLADIEEAFLQMFSPDPASPPFWGLDIRSR